MTARTASGGDRDASAGSGTAGEGDDRREAAVARADSPSGATGDGGGRGSTPGDRETRETDAPTVLLVDDEEELVDVYARWLGEACTVRTAYSGEAALRRAEDVDVVFLDRKMPGLSGEAVLERLADREADPKIVFLSAFEPDDAVADLSYDGYLEKPVSKRELLETIEALVGEE